MFVLSMRSSSYGTYKSCEHSYFLQYVLGFRTPSGLAASKGNIVHKCLELLALRKLCEQENIKILVDDDIGEIDPSLLTFEKAMEISVEHYKKVESHIEFKPRDIKDCYAWGRMALDYKDGVFNPLNRNIITPEKKFAIEIKEPWAAYDFDVQGRRVAGNLVLQGTVDLITKLDDNTYEIIDWKTGSCVDFFNNFKRKDYESFTKDPQLLIYYYAVRNLYPDIDNVIFTIVWVKDGGPYTVAFDHQDYLYAEKLIKNQFESIKNNNNPNLHIGKHCSFCWFNKNQYKDSGQTYCEFFSKQVKKHGVKATAEFYGDMSKLGSYGDGGGRKSKEGKDE